jgi:hypothetical protein
MLPNGTAVRQNKKVQASKLQLLPLESLRLAQLLDDLPPFLGIGLHQRAQRSRRLSLASKNLKSEIAITMARRRIGKYRHHGGVELVDDVWWRSLGCKKPDPASVLFLTFDSHPSSPG